MLWEVKEALLMRMTFVLLIATSPRSSTDLEAGLRAEAAALGISVDALIASAVKAYLRDGTSPAARRIPSRDRSAEMAWASHPDAQFTGKWVVLQAVTSSPVAPIRNSSTKTCEQRATPRHS